jgi:hypothetical protein
MLPSPGFVSNSEICTSTIENGLNYEIKNYGVEAIFNGTTSLLNSMKIYQLVQTLLGETHRQ